VSEQFGIARPDIRLHDPAWRQLQKYRMARFKGPKLNLPFGYSADGTAYLGVRPPGQDKLNMLHAEHILRDPKPGCKYAWRVRNDDYTFGLVEGHQIRPVAYDRVLKEKMIAAGIFPYAGPGGVNYAGYGRMGLFEVPPQVAYEWYDHPADWAMTQVMNRSDDFGREVEQYTQGKMTGHIEVRDVRRGG
jgi:hypothetical protein